MMESGRFKRFKMFQVRLGLPRIAVSKAKNLRHMISNLISKVKNHLFCRLLWRRSPPVMIRRVTSNF